MLLFHDIFSRFLWVEPITRKTQVRRASKDISEEYQRSPRELNTDMGSELRAAASTIAGRLV